MNGDEIRPHYTAPYPKGARVRVIQDVTDGIDLQEDEPGYINMLGTVTELLGDPYWTTRVRLDDGRQLIFDPTRELELVDDEDPS